jgi:glycosyltransferase involved in cell wall biosynthesis
MKILMLADVFFPDTVGGAGRVAYHLSTELSRKGHEVHIVTRDGDGMFPSNEKKELGLFIHRFFTPTKESIRMVISEIKNSHLLCRRLSKKIKFDLICFHQSFVAVGPMLMGCFKNIPSIYYFNSPWHEEFSIKKREDRSNTTIKNLFIASWMRRVESQMISRATKIVVLSRYMYKKARKIHPDSENKLVKIPGGVETDFFSLSDLSKAQMKQCIGLPQDKTVFLTVRNLVPRMGIEALIEAFHQSHVLRERGLLLIGGKGPLEEDLKSLAASADLDGVVRFLGRIPDQDLTVTYQGADFFVLPTRKLEGFGLVILEAMASGTPVLGTPVGAIPEIIGAFDKRLIFDGIHWQDMKTKLEDTILKPEEYDFDPKACRKFVEDNFTWQKMAEHFEREAIALVK